MSSTNKHIYDYDVDLSSDTAAAHVVRMVGHNKKVLELGAGPGSITKHLKNTGQCAITAVEYDGSALPWLRPYCDSVHQLDLNQRNWSTALDDNGPFDVIVAADVLEHLYSPSAVLEQMRLLLAPEGCIIVSLPHISHAAVMATMLNENFRYGDWGLLDRTHIRFFGLTNIQDLFAQAGLKIVAREFVIRAPEMTEFVDCWTQTPVHVRNFLLQYPAGLIYQVVVKAVPLSSHEPGITLFDNLPSEAPDLTSGQRAYAWIKGYIPEALRPQLRRLRYLILRR